MPCFFCRYDSLFKNPELGSQLNITFTSSAWKVISHDFDRCCSDLWNIFVNGALLDVFLYLCQLILLPRLSF